MVLAARRVAAFAGSVLMACALNACALACPGAGPGAGPGRAPAHIVTAAPGTHRLTLTDATRRCLLDKLESGELRVARLTLAGLRPRNAQALKGVRVFVQGPAVEGPAVEGPAVEGPAVDAPAAHVNAVDASGRAGTASGPQAAGAFVLGLEAEQTYLLDIAPALDALWRSGALDADALSAEGGLRLSFVAEPWEEGPALPPDFALPIANIRLDVPCD